MRHQIAVTPYATAEYQLVAEFRMPPEDRAALNDFLQFPTSDDEFDIYRRQQARPTK